MRVHGAFQSARRLGVAVAAFLAVACAREREGGDLPRPLRQDIADPLCVPPLLPPPRHAQLPCDVPLEPCGDITLVVEVTAEGRAGAAYIKEHPSDAFDACLTSTVRDWQFVPGRDCRGRAVPAVWQRHYSGLCT